MLGFSDPWILTVFILCILSALLCVIWGVLFWNKNAGDPSEAPEAVQHWAEEEDRVESEL